MRSTVGPRGLIHRLLPYTPFTRWVGELRDGAVLRADLIAGVTVAMIIISLGEQTLRNLIERLRDIGVDIFFTRAKKQFKDVLARTGCMDYIGRDHFFSWNQHALEYLWGRLDPQYSARCPLNIPRSSKPGTFRDDIT